MVFSHTHTHYGAMYPKITIREITGEDFEDPRELSRRTELQKWSMPRMAAEYVIDMTLSELRLPDNGVATIHALAAHAAELGFNPVWGGYRGRQFVQEGLLFGEMSDQGAQKINASGVFSAIDKDGWLENVGYAKNNPFDHMVRGTTLENHGPIIVAYDADLLEADPNNTHTKRPKHNKQIQEVVAAVYHPRGQAFGRKTEEL